MIIEGVVGPRALSDGNQPTARFGRQGDIITSNLHGDYAEGAVRKTLFHVATPSGQTTTVGLATTYVGLCVSNPIGSGVNAYIVSVSCAQSVINAAVNAVGLAIGFNGTTNVTHTTPATPKNCFIGSSVAPACLADTAATLPTAPTYAGWISDTPTATTNPAAMMFEMKGMFIVPPGGYFMTATVAASPAAAFWAAIVWEEQPA
jgi:hypothetical protein